MNWKRKLTSRKFLISILAIIIGLFFAYGGDADAVGEICGNLISASAAIVYIVGESYADGKNNGGDDDVI